MGEDNKLEFTEFGYIQAKLLAKRLSNIKFEEVLVSDLIRSVQTANEILKENPIQKVTSLKELREKNYGILEGKPHGVYSRLVKKKGVDERIFRPYGGENWLEVFLRVRKFLYALIEKYVSPYHFQALKANFDKRNETILNNFKAKLAKDPSSIEKMTEERGKTIEKLENALQLDKKLMVEDIDSLYPVEDIQMNDDQKKLQEANLEKISQELASSQENEENAKISEFNPEDIDQYLQTLDLSSLLVPPYLGYDPNSELKRILVVSHSGFISELINLIRKYGNLKPNIKNETTSAGIHIIRIYCSFCGYNTICQNKQECQDSTYRLEFDHIWNNNADHLGMLQENV